MLKLSQISMKTIGYGRPCEDAVLLICNEILIFIGLWARGLYVFVIIVYGITKRYLHIISYHSGVH